MKGRCFLSILRVTLESLFSMLTGQAGFVCVDEHSNVGHVSLVGSRFGVGFSVSFASLASLFGSLRVLLVHMCSFLVCVEACLMCVAREAVCFDQTVPGVFGIAFDFVSPLIGFLGAGPGQIDAPIEIYVVANHESVPCGDGQMRSGGKLAPKD